VLHARWQAGARGYWVIGKVLRGTRVQGLIRYLYGPGRAEEHRNPHIVAGFRDPAELEPVIRADGSRDFRRLEGLLAQPLALLGERNYRKPVWHLPVRAAPEDPILTDQRWAQVARNIDRPEHSVLRELLGALMHASGQVRRIGVNLNQAVAALNSGEFSDLLSMYAQAAYRTVLKLDEVADEVRVLLP
jgi:hypothetical protein